MTSKYEIHLIRTKVVPILAEDKDHAYEIAETKYGLDKHWEIDKVIEIE